MRNGEKGRLGADVEMTSIIWQSDVFQSSLPGSHQEEVTANWELVGSRQSLECQFDLLVLHEKKNKEGERKEDYDTHLNKKCKKHEDALYLQIRHTLIYTSTHIRIYLH